jgi:carbamoyltransferase
MTRGAMEAGPRALGNRSILARADDAEVAARVNRVKLREAWRPLGPSVILGAADTLFDRPVPSPYMLLFRTVRGSARKTLAGTTHVDGTTRPQTVTPESNAEFYRLLRAVGELTGTPAVINTSFNVGPEPIVCTPLDAIRAFVTSEIDALFLDDFVLRKPRD